MAKTPLRPTDTLTVRQEGKPVTAAVGDLPKPEAPAAIDMQAALAAYFGANPPVSSQMLAAAVAAYLKANPPAKGDGPTAAEVKAAVEAYFAANPMRRIEFVSGVSGTEIVFSTPFAAAPLVVPLMGWLGNNQIVIPTVAASAVTKAKLLMGAKRSRGTLLLTSGPFEDAPAGTAVQAIVIGT